MENGLFHSADFISDAYEIVIGKLYKTNYLVNKGKTFVVLVLTYLTSIRQVK